MVSAPHPCHRGFSRHVEKLCPVGAELGVPWVAEFIPAPWCSYVALHHRELGYPHCPCSQHPLVPVLVGVCPWCFIATVTAKECRRSTPPCPDGSKNCVSFPQSLVQSRKAGITSALASSTLNNEELVGAGAGWGMGNHGGRVKLQTAGPAMEMWGLFHTSILLWQCQSSQDA